jgi:hypothetical protein
MATPNGIDERIALAVKFFEKNILRVNPRGSRFYADHLMTGSGNLSLFNTLRRRIKINAGADKLSHAFSIFCLQNIEAQRFI